VFHLVVEDLAVEDQVDEDLVVEDLVDVYVLCSAVRLIFVL